MTLCGRAYEARRCWKQVSTICLTGLLSLKGPKWLRVDFGSAKGTRHALRPETALQRDGGEMGC
jgi:hypothetical protein